MLCVHPCGSSPQKLTRQAHTRTVPRCPPPHVGHETPAFHCITVALDPAPPAASSTSMPITRSIIAASEITAAKASSDAM